VGTSGAWPCALSPRRLARGRALHPSEHIARSAWPHAPFRAWCAAMATRTKVLGLAALRRRLAAHRRAGERIVFTNGVFDLIHPGHVRYLRAARRLGDRLVVGINSDRSVRRLEKGPDRPLVGERDRA